MAENKCAARLEPSNRDMSELKNRFKPGYDWETICSTMLEHLMCGVAIYELCPDRVRSLYLNKKYYEMVGYTKEQYEQYADSVTSSLYGDSAEMIFEKAGRSAKTGETFYAECKGRRYDGSDIWVFVKAKLVDFIESEHPVFLAIVQDMTNRKLAEYENAVNLERYRILEATSNAVTFEYDIPDDIMTFSYNGGKADSANRSISNYAEVSKRTKIVYPDDAAKFYAALLKWEIPFHDEEWACVSAPGTEQGMYPGIMFQRNPEYEPPVWPEEPEAQQQMAHLDFAVNDLDEAVRHAVQCGAAIANEQFSEDWKVMIDPAGHPFCLCQLKSMIESPHFALL